MHTTSHALCRITPQCASKPSHHITPLRPLGPYAHYALVVPRWSPDGPLVVPWWSPDGPLMVPWWSPDGPLVVPWWPACRSLAVICLHSMTLPDICTTDPEPNPSHNPDPDLISAFNMKLSTYELFSHPTRTLKGWQVCPSIPKL